MALDSCRPAAPVHGDAGGALGEGERHIDAVLRCDGWLAKTLLRVVPRSRGSWLIGAAAARLLPAGVRRSSLTLSIAGTTIRIALDLTDPVQFSMANHRRFDLMTAFIVAAALDAGETFVDVGANWGYFTCIGASRVGPAGVVVAIEPSRIATRRLQETVRRNRLTNVITVPEAASSVVGRGVSVVRPFFRQTTGSYVQDGRPGRPPDALTTTLDALVGRLTAGPVRLVKVDTEGAELPVMRGAASLLDRDRPLVILEISQYSRRFGYTVPQLYDHMRAHGYVSAYRVDDEVRHLTLCGPLTEMREGQILFQHERSPVRVSAEAVRARVSIG